MKRRLSTARIDLMVHDLAFELSIPGPGNLVRAKTTFVDKKTLINMQKPPLVPELRMTFEVDPDAPTRRRRFLLLPEGITVVSRGTVAFLAPVEDPTKPEAILAIFEEQVTECQRPATAAPDAHVYPAGSDRCECGETERDPDPEVLCTADAHTFVGGSNWCVCGETTSTFTNVSEPS